MWIAEKCGDLDLRIFKYGDLDFFAVLVMDFKKFQKSPNPSVRVHCFTRLYQNIFKSQSFRLSDTCFCLWTVSLFDTIVCHLIDPRLFSKPTLMFNWA